MNQEIMKTEVNDPEEPRCRKRTGQRFTGFILGMIFGGLTMLAYFLKASPSEFYGASKMMLILILLGCGAFGALVGPNVMEKAGEWLSWIA